jgi:hypothetical protein
VETDCCAKVHRARAIGRALTALPHPAAASRRTSIGTSTWLSWARRARRGRHLACASAVDAAYGAALVLACASAVDAAYGAALVLAVPAAFGLLDTSPAPCKGPSAMRIRRFIAASRRSVDRQSADEAP